MEREDFKLLVKGMKAVYAQPTFIPDKDAFDIWYQMLHDLDYKVANAAVQKYILTNKFPPTIADIREMAVTVSAGEKPLWSDGWDQTLKAIRKYGSYNPAAAMESLDDITRQTVQRLGYVDLCRSENIMADRANFRMIFEQIADRKHKNDQLSTSLTQLISGLQERKEIESGERKRLSVANPET